MNFLLDWHDFIYFALPTVAICALGAYLGFKEKFAPAITVTVLALIVFGVYIAGMWHSLERPPMRTMGETRLWYSFFVIIAGLIVYSRWRYRWILGFSTILSTVFICINIFKPEIHSKTMMPALESPFFVPHVISYMFAYGMLGAALLLAIYMLYKKEDKDPHRLYVTDNLVYTGTGFLIVGLLLGAIWAKQAWGTYWGWDPQRDLGGDNHGCLYAVHPPPPFPPQTLQAVGDHPHRQLPLPPDVLVRRQLPPLSRRQHPHVFKLKKEAIHTTKRLCHNASDIAFLLIPYPHKVKEL